MYIFKFHFKIYEPVIVEFCMRVQVNLRQVIGRLDCSEINFAIDFSLIVLHQADYHTMEKTRFCSHFPPFSRSSNQIKSNKLKQVLKMFA